MDPWLLVVLATAEVFDGLAVLQNGQGVQLADVMLLEPLEPDVRPVHSNQVDGRVTVLQTVQRPARQPSTPLAGQNRGQNC